MNTLELLDAPWAAEYTPVTARHGGNIPTCRVLAASGSPICDIDGEASDEMHVARVRIIAAAPDLYEALGYFFNIMHDYESSRRKGYIRAAFDKPAPPSPAPTRPSDATLAAPAHQAGAASSR